MKKDFCNIYATISEIHRIIADSSTNDVYSFYAERYSESVQPGYTYWRAFFGNIQGAILYGMGLYEKAAAMHKETYMLFQEVAANPEDQFNAPPVENVYNEMLWSLLELGFDYAKLKRFGELDDVIREFRRQAIHTKNLNVLYPHSMPAEYISPDNKVCVFGHHYELLKLTAALYKGELAKDKGRVEEFLEISKMSLAERHFDEYRTLFDEMMKNGYHDTAHKVLMVMFDMLNTVSSLKMSRFYWTSCADYYRKVGDTDNFIRSFEVLEKLTFSRKELTKQMKLHAMEKKDAVFRHRMDMRKEDRRKRLLSYQAGTDALTGLSNRYGVEEYGPDAVENAAEHKQQLGVLLIDIDHFKYFNDNYGHLVGDEFIKKSSTLINRVFSGHFVSRYSGDSFIVVMKDVSVEEIQRLTGELCVNLLNLQLAEAHSDIERDMITVSQGAVYTRPNFNTTWQDIVAAADRTLTAAKENGRNCIMISKYELPRGKINGWTE